MITPAILACAASLVHPVTMAAVITVESHGDPIAVNVNGIGRQHPRDLAEAVAITRRYLALGYRVDLGLTQVDSENLASVGLDVESAFDPCLNVRAGATILAADYQAAVQRFGAGQGALGAALSAYNTGSFERGFRNGYVAKYLSLKDDLFRPIPTYSGQIGQNVPRSAKIGHDVTLAARDPYSADTTIFESEKPDVPVN